MNEILVKRYADAFMEYAQDSIGRDKAIEDSKNIKLILSENPELLKLFKAPELGSQEKLRLIDHLLDKYITHEFKNFLKLLLKKGRINIVLDIAEYIRVNYSFGEKKQVLLTTSYPVELDLFPKILEKLEKRLGKEIKLYMDLDGSLLGGVKAVMGNTVIDASIRRRLYDLRENLKELRMV